VLELGVDFCYKMCEQPLRELVEKIPFDLSLLPPESYLVGGAVRDRLLQRQREYLDLDFVLGREAVETARQVAKQYQAGFVLLDAGRQIARVVFKTGTIDFALQEGEILTQDLQRRDFTINAIALNPHTLDLIDPLNGCTDLEQGVLRMVSEKNLVDDPLRILRAYRQGSQLQFTLDPTTQETMTRLAPLIKNVAAERVQTELGYLLNDPQGTPWLRMAGEDGLLQPWIETVTPQKLQQVAQVDQVTPSLPELIQHNPDAPRLAKLACLVSSDPDVAETQLVTLKYSRQEVRTVVTALRSLPKVISNPAMNLREQYFFFLEVGDAFPTLALLAGALGVKEATIQPLVQRYLNPDDQVAHPQPLVTGKDLIQALSLSPSPLIGTLLTEIQIARIEGKVTTPEAAIQYAKEIQHD
jgi:tRNA nucleotidyltransferase (CCA-adding enzyme)